MYSHSPDDVDLLGEEKRSCCKVRWRRCSEMSWYPGGRELWNLVQNIGVTYYWDDLRKWHEVRSNKASRSIRSLRLQGRERSARHESQTCRREQAGRPWGRPWRCSARRSPPQNVRHSCPNRAALPCESPPPALFYRYPALSTTPLHHVSLSPSPVQVLQLSRRKSNLLAGLSL